MSDNPWLLVDVSCLAYRSMYAMPEVSHDGELTGALFGVFRTVLNLMDLFATDRVAWFFDRGYGYRKMLWPSYKEDRRKARDLPWAKEQHRQMRRQIFRLREKYLPEVGFRNIIGEDDYEADDVIASACLGLKAGSRAIIVSSDNDMYQMLSCSVSIWRPGVDQPYTMDFLLKEWGLSPSQWVEAKAIAGCPGDGVVGVRGVGIKTAAKFILGELNPKCKAFNAIVSGADIKERNLPLVSLPFVGTPEVTLHDDELSDRAWGKVMSDLGITTLRDRLPRRRSR